ncbi:MAG: DUF3276 family protein, partial [Bacteroidota bacterium]
VLSEKIKAGKKTYFFDIKSTRAGDSYYLVIKESIKVYHENGSPPSFNKSKLLVYPEDMNRFLKMVTTMADRLGGLVPKEAFTKFDDRE